MVDKELPEKSNQLSFDAWADQLLERVSKSKAKTALAVEVQAKVRSQKEPSKVFDPDIGSDKKPDILTVGQLNKQIKAILEKNYATVWVKGEISNFKIYGSGHMYFTLKDEESAITGVMFAGHAKVLKFKPQDGMEVIVRAQVSLYLQRGNHQLLCEVMEPVGFGALQAAYEQLKAKLTAEGLFELARKRPLPPYPERIALITSPTGAAVRDMLNILHRRAAGSVQVTVIPTSVQGDKAPAEICAAIELANKLACFDVLIVGRGGGGIEDLWAFNTESVIRAIAASRIPTISAVGHEVDFTIADFVADLRAPTPSAAAELVAKNKADLADRVQLLTRSLVQQMKRDMGLFRQKVLALTRGLVDPKRRLQDLSLRADDLGQRLNVAIGRFITDNRMHVRLLIQKLSPPTLKIQKNRTHLGRLELQMASRMAMAIESRRTAFLKTAGRLDGLSPLKVLDRGFSIVKKGQEVIKKTEQVAAGDRLQITVSNGELSCQIL